MRYLDAEAPILRSAGAWLLERGQHVIETEVQVYPWSKEGTPSEDDLRRTMAAEGLQPHRWSNAPCDTYSAHSHTYHKVLYVVEGSITFRLPETGQQLTLRAGDRLELPAHTRHDAVVGTEGVVCLEAHKG